MSLQLREYQARAVKEVLGSMLSGKHTLLTAPCGAGKTEMASAVIEGLPADKRVMFVVHRRILREQAFNRLTRNGLVASEYNEDRLEPDDGLRIQVATVQSLLGADCQSRLRPDFIIFDEAHHYEAEQWSVVRRRYPDAIRLGLTATPQRSDGLPLGPQFDVHLQGGTYGELEELGFICKRQIWTPPHRVKGLAMDPVSAWQLCSGGSQTIVSCGRINEARALAAKFTAAGVPAMCVDSGNHDSSTSAWNMMAIESARAGETKVLTNVFCLSEGFDLPAIRTVILCRSFHFRATYMQFVGRALRASPGKRDAIIIDLTGATAVHGDPGADYDWNLFSQPTLPRTDDEPRGAGTGVRHIYDRTVSNDALERTQHGAMDPDEFEQVVELPNRPRSLVYRSLLLGLEKRARALARKKGGRIAAEHFEREKQRVLGFNVKL